MIARAQLIFAVISFTCFSIGCSSKTPDADNATQQLALNAVRDEVHEVSGKMTALVGNVDSSQKKLTAIEDGIAALVGNADSSRKRLIGLEERVRTAAPAELNDAVADYSALQESLTTLEGIELTENIAAIGWSIALRKSLTAPITSNQLLEAEALMQQVPRALVGKIADQYAEQMGTATVKFAQELSIHEPPDADELGVADDLLGLLETRNGPSENSISELRKTIAMRLEAARQERVRTELALQVDGIKEQLTAADKIADTDLRRSAVMGLSQSVETMRLQRTFQGLDQGLQELAEIHKQLNAEVSTSLESLGNEQRTKLGKARMRYQAWALKEIAKMKDFLDDDKVEKELYQLRDKSAEAKDPVIVDWADFAGVRKLLQEGIGEIAANRPLSAEQQKTIGPFVNSNWDSIRYQVRHDAAVRHLLHVDQNLLEPPVAKFFSAAFEQVWTQLGDREDLQLSLAQMTAEINKWSLDTFMESKNE